jgi:hypothetical protein
MWNDNDEVNENGDSVKLYIPVQVAHRRNNTAAKDSHIGGRCFLESDTPSCDFCDSSMFLLVQLRSDSDQENPSSERYFSVFACPRETCFEQFKFNKGFSSGGQGLFKCVGRNVDTDFAKPYSALPVVATKSSWYNDDNYGKSDDDDDNEWGLDTDNNIDESALEKAITAMEMDLNKDGALKSSTKSSPVNQNQPSKAGPEIDGFTCYMLKVQNEPMATMSAPDEDDVGLLESDEKIRNMLARYMAEEDDEEILSALRGTDICAGGGKGEEDERLSEEDRILLSFQDRLRRVPRQVVRYARGGRPLWSVPDKNRKTGKQLWDVPECRCCGQHRRFEFQLLPSVLATLEVDSFARSGTKTGSDEVHLEDLLSNGMNFGSIAVFTCNSASCEGNNEPFLVVQKSVDDLPQKAQSGNRKLEREMPVATMAIVEDLDDDDEFELDT